MPCFSLWSIEHLFIWLVVVIAVFAIIRIVLSSVTAPAEFAWLINVMVQIIRIVLWAVIIIAVVVLIFELLACLVPFR
jgi:hypothetical protein